MEKRCFYNNIVLVWIYFIKLDPFTVDQLPPDKLAPVAVVVGDQFVDGIKLAALTVNVEAPDINVLSEFLLLFSLNISLLNVILNIELIKGKLVLIYS